MSKKKLKKPDIENIDLAAKFKASIMGLKRSSTLSSTTITTGSEIIDGSTQSKMISTGFYSVDHILNGGLGPGRIYEVYGPNSSGKTTLAINIAKSLQDQDADYRILYVDMEGSLDGVYLQSIGIDLDRLLLIQPRTGEEALEAIETMIRSRTVKLIVLDSLATLVPKAEIEQGINKDTMGLQARLVSKALRILNPLLVETDTIWLILNQIRKKIGVMFGNPETTPGGESLGFYTTGRLEIRRSDWIKEDDTIIGQKSRIKMTKHKLGPPQRVNTIDIIFGKGISKENELISMFENIDHTGVELSGSWYKIDGKSVAQGKKQFRLFLQENPKVVEQLKERIEIVKKTPTKDRAKIKYKAIKYEQHNT